MNSRLINARTKLLIMENTIIRSLILFFSMPLINALAFGFSAIFHDMYHSKITMEQFEAYEFSMMSMICLLAIAIPLLEGLYIASRISNRTTNILYILVFVIIGVISFDQFVFRPYEHSLTFLSVISLIFSREFLNKKTIVGPEFVN